MSATFNYTFTALITILFLTIVISVCGIGLDSGNNDAAVVVAKSPTPPIPPTPITVTPSPTPSPTVPTATSSPTPIPQPVAPPRPTATYRPSNVAPLAEESILNLKEYGIRLGQIVDPVLPANHDLVLSPQAGMRYVAYVMVFGGDVYVNALNFTLKGADGFVYKHKSIFRDTSSRLTPIQLDRDSKTFGWIAFSVREDAKLVELVYKPIRGESPAIFRATTN